MMKDKIQWCIDQHTNTNHFYDTYLPYHFHLRMVVQAAKDFLYLVENETDKEIVILSAWGHDLIEDCRVSFNDVSTVMGKDVAEVVYALTNEKGKNRKERANDKYYDGIVNTPNATFVKLCDRIANVQYSKMTKSSMFDVYSRENPEFIRKLRYNDNHPLKKMFDYLIGLLENKQIS